MPYKLTYFREARNDIAASKKWYYDRQRGLEKRFAADIKITVLRLSASPYAHTIRYKNTRIAHTDVFPYSIHYYINEQLKSVVIVGVVHISREFDFLYHRT